MKKQDAILQGVIPFQIVKLAAPLLVGDILQQFYNTIDAVIIGKYIGMEAFAAVGVASTVMNLFLFALVGFSLGVSILFSQYYGMKDYKRFREESFLALVPGSVAVVMFSVLSLLLMNPILRIIRTPDALLLYAKEYLAFIIGGMVISYLYNICASLLRSIGDTKSSLIFLTISITVNGMLDILFVGKLGIGIKGAAIATCIAQLLSAVLSIAYIRAKYPLLLFGKSDFQFKKSSVKITIHYGMVSLVHQASLYIGKLLIQGAVNTLGIYGISAYTSTTRVEGFINSFSNSGGQAISTLTAQNHGAQNTLRVKGGLKWGLILMILFGLISSIAMYVGAAQFIKLINHSVTENEMHIGIGYLRCISIFYVLCFTASSFVGYFRGIGCINIALTGTILHITARVVLSYILMERYSLTAVAIASSIGWCMVVTFHLITYMHGKSSVRYIQSKERYSID
jgi:putative MATE family efflux protein